MATAAESLSSPHIVVVDDNPDDRLLVTRGLLRQWPGCHVEAVAEPLALEAALRQAPPDLVITDYQLQWGTGLEVFARVRAAWPDCPVVMFTGTGSEEVAVAALQSGLDDYVLKSPRHYAVLPERVRLVLERARDRTRLAAAQAALAASDARLRSVTDQLREVIFQLDAEGCCQLLSRAWTRITGLPVAECIGRPFDTFVHADDRAAALDRYLALMHGGTDLQRSVLRLLRADGSLRWVEVHARPSSDAEGRVNGLAGTLTDITARHQAEAKLRLYATVFERSADAIYVTDADGTIVAVNQAFSRITGYSAAEAEGCTPRLLKSGHQDRAFYEGLWGDLLRSGHWRGEIWDRRRDGSQFPSWLSLAAVHDEAGATTHFIAIQSDLSERKQAEARIHFLSQHDALTGLPNRALLAERIEQALGVARREGGTVAVLHLDLDRFKVVNDSLGPTAADQLLRGMAERLHLSLRIGDTLARQGGDEFLAVARCRGGAAEATQFARRLLGVVSEPLDAGERDLSLTGSIGISLFPDDGGDADTLLKAAGSALHTVKARGGNGYALHTPELAVQAQERLRLETALRGALDAGEFQLHYQPQLDLASGRLFGVEALLRWQHPEFGHIPPQRFIPLAEETGLIVPIGDWVIARACRDLADWGAQGIAPPRVAVNLSARQFAQPQLFARVKALLEASGLPPGRLEVEITESLLMQDPEATVATLRAFVELGVSVSIDDFGTGYSSLSYLRRFPIHTLKIDRSFVIELGHDASDAAIVSAIIAMAHRLGLQVIAEGVETAAQRDFLAAEGCDAIQGYWLARPMPAAACAEWMRGHDAQAA
ncbi:PAS domain S-box-containing protein/diguanylate cyclase (GGDEF)-like protein [Plasticicumulans lactativorans]|uniref:cyclic-guanylate-specific phosphodiesterase n=1 Tax=Plasticicumulans lactativorans TaxID=1133106 RepID=A0A4R2LV45_9GAMM|nr:EAL domain-containing protein [Plasticicumulans lactativorans]TCO83790.1 PAS domain S-box-containing protein/diguanylate cyclase (GGDEF)-like protein [Plasticicumulans lactativorans]